ncbi:sentrin-specific protease 1-like isoform X2 [Mizuhopecten yessoensis]|uniref:sentrin-specific protease 1-like isoform X2 n=1 Tax=Mizuhopecten yessoensis TaxID=6573 RepID=UPI000B457F2A|nr:sentrin-specific protease 1-like isoform X2 [Mizuhopecten yessoensis]
MLSSLTTRVRTFLFKDEGTIAHEQSSRKRKRVDECSENGEDDEDVVIVSVKRPKVETKSLFSRVLSSPYKKMSDWVRNKTKWNDSFFSRPKLKNDSRSTPNFEQTPRNGRLNGGQNPHVLRQEKFQANRAVSKSSEEAELRKKDTESLQDRRWQQPRQQQKAESQSRIERVTSVPTQTEDVIMLNGNGGHNERGQNQVIRQKRTSSLNFTAHNCVDYEEKEQYRQLLQQFTTAPVTPGATPKHKHSRPKSPSTMSHRSVDNLSFGSLSQSLSSKNWTTNNRSRHSTPSRPFTEMNGTSFLKRHTPVVDMLKKSAVARAPMYPQVHTDTDSYRTKSKSTENLSKSKSSEWSTAAFKDSQYITDEWADDILTKYSVEARERNRKIAEQEVKSKVYEERRKAREEHLEKEIQIRMKVLSTEPAFAEEPTIEEIEQEEEEVEEDEKEEVFPELTDEMDRIISNALRPHPEHEVLVEAFRLQITRKDMATLSGLNWLNDEIINFYMNLLMERGKGEGKAKVYTCNTFFYPKIVSGGHSAVRRWTKRVDIFAQDYIIIPVHLGMHWCLAVVDFKKKLVQYFDSMGGENQQCLNAIKKYLCDESKDKKKQEFNLTGWSTEIVKDIPQQMNGSDCGMFACKYAEYITRGAEITFTQEHMPYFRRRMVYEVLQAKLLQ